MAKLFKLLSSIDRFVAYTLLRPVIPKDTVYYCTFNDDLSCTHTSVFNSISLLTLLLKVIRHAFWF